MLKKLIFISVFSCCGIALSGQSSRPLPFLEVNPDVRTAAMGDAAMGGTRSMFLYTNPTAFFQNDGKFYTSYAFGLYPEIAGSRQTYHAISAGYKIFNRHALFAGFRYFSGLKVPRVGEDGIERKPVQPRDWAIDFAYAFNFSPHFSAYAGGAFIQSYNSKTAYTGSLTTGVYYHNSLQSFNNEKGSYSVGISLNNLGGKVKYGKNGTESDLPASVAAGGSVSLPVDESHKLNAALTMRYFILPSDAKAFTGGMGLEYEMFDIATLRTGYHWGNDNNYLTVGAGFNVKFVNIDAAYILARSKDFNLLRIGMNILF